MTMTERPFCPMCGVETLDWLVCGECVAKVAAALGCRVESLGTERRVSNLAYEGPEKRNQS